MIVMELDTPPRRADIPELCERLRSLIEASETNRVICDVDRVICDVGSLTEFDAASVEALARLQLTARRLGREIRLRQPSTTLQLLLSVTGLCEVLPATDE